MQKKALKICGFTLVLGIFGAFLRWLQLQNVIEPDTGLATPHAPLSYAFIAFLLLGALLLFFWTRAYKNAGLPLSYPEAYACGQAFFRIAALIIAVVMGLGGILMLAYALKSSRSIFDLTLGLFAFVAAVSAYLFLADANTPGKKATGRATAAILVVFLCYWLIAAYKFSASDPVIWQFAPRLLAVSSTILAFYYIAGFGFGRPKPLAALFFSLLSSVLCIITLADAYPIGEQLIAAAFALFSLILAYAQVSRAGSAPESGSVEDSVSEAP